MFKIISRVSSVNKELLVHSVIALIVRLGGAGAAFLMNIVVARYLKVEEAGYFFLAVSIVTVMAAVGRIGADQTVLRFVSVYSNKGEWHKVQSVLRSINKWSLIPLSIITALICIFSRQISIYLFHKEALTWPLFWCSLSMPFFALYNIYAQALQGRKKVILSVSSLKILTPVFLVVLMLFLSPHDSSKVSLYYLIACILNLVVGYFWWKQNIPQKIEVGESIDKSMLWKSCYPLWITAIMQQVIIWGGQFIAGIFNSPQELAQLAVARNTSVLITFVLTAVNYVSAPRFATMYHEGKLEQLKKYAITTTRLLTIAALPIVLFMWFFPEFIMSLFGDGFSEGRWLLRILILGQFVNVITGSVGYLLIMSGHERDLRNVTIIAGTGAIVLAFILNPIFGAIGSALSTAIAVACSNLLAVGYVKKRLGFNTLSMFGFK